MTILNKKFIGKENYIELVVLDERLSDSSDLYQYLVDHPGKVFFEFSAWLLDDYSSMTQSFSPFDPWNNTQIIHADEIYELSASFLLWQFQLSRAPENYFHKMDEFYQRSTLSDQEKKDVTRSQMKFDMIETLGHLTTTLNQIAFQKKCLGICGI